jgi:hypothetical protein
VSLEGQCAWTENGQLHHARSCPSTLLSLPLPLFFHHPHTRLPYILLPYTCIITASLLPTLNHRLPPFPTYDPVQPYHLIIQCPTILNQPRALIVRRSATLTQLHTENIPSTEALGDGWPSSDSVHDRTSHDSSSLPPPPPLTASHHAICSAV